MKEPEFYRLLVHAKGKPGEIEADAEMNLEETEKEVLLTCNADVEVTGLLASIGQRIIGGVAKVIIGQLFKDIKAIIKHLKEENRTMVLTSHNYQDIEEFSDGVYLIGEGKLELLTDELKVKYFSR